MVMKLRRYKINVIVLTVNYDNLLYDMLLCLILLFVDSSCVVYKHASEYRQMLINLPNMTTKPNVLLYYVV